MANFRPLTEAEQENIAKRLGRGETLALIREATGRSEETIRKFARETGLRTQTVRRSDWPEEDVETMRQLFDDGLSFSLIAQRLGRGLTRNACIGKANRLGWTRALPSAPARVKSGAAVRNHPPRAKRARSAKPRKQRQHNNFAGLNTQRRAQSPKREVPVLPVIVDATHAKPWTERAFGECAYPIIGEGADLLSCCHRTGGKTYCPAHRAIMFRKPDPINVVRANAQRRAATMRGGKERAA